MSEEDYKIAYENVMIANKMLEQENKQLKEDFRILKQLQMATNDILNDLEEWVKNEYNRYKNDKENLVFSNVEMIDYERVLNKIQELKEKYK